MWNTNRRNLTVVMLLFVFSTIFTGCGRSAQQTGTAYDAGQSFADLKWQNMGITAEKIFAGALQQVKFVQALQQVKEENPIVSEPIPVIPVAVPALPERGQGLSDFVPEGWSLMDSVELDFNKDKIADYVGVLNIVWQEDGKYDYRNCPRILFAVESSADGCYILSFQDENLIRNSNEGGIYGNPYLPLTAEDASFTTHAYGGSAWKWSEDYTYSYKEGTWYLAKSESTYGYQSYITSYDENDWEAGIGIRRERNYNIDEAEKHWDEEPVYDIVYEVTLDGMPTLEQAGKRWWLAPDRITDWEVKSLLCAEDITGVTDNPGLVKQIEESLGRCYIDCNNEYGMLYTYFGEKSDMGYLMLYHLEDKTLSVLAQFLSAYNIKGSAVDWYQGKIYYTTEIIENIAYKTIRDGIETVVQEERTVGLILHRMNEDGSRKEDIFEYRYPGAEKEIMDGAPPFLTFTYEISGGEIILEMWIGNDPHLYYRMNIDGSNVRQIGQVPK